eukprot:6412521-Prymnesium_polylepis.1
MGEAMLLIDSAISVPTYQAMSPLGMVLGGVVTAFVTEPRLAAICVGLATLFVVPAAAVLAKTIGSRTRRLADAYATAGGYCAEVLGS